MVQTLKPSYDFLPSTGVPSQHITGGGGAEGDLRGIPSRAGLELCWCGVFGAYTNWYLGCGVYIGFYGVYNWYWYTGWLGMIMRIGIFYLATGFSWKGWYSSWPWESEKMMKHEETHWKADSSSPNEKTEETDQSFSEKDGQSLRKSQSFTKKKRKKNTKLKSDRSTRPGRSRADSRGLRSFTSLGVSPKLKISL